MLCHQTFPSLMILCPVCNTKQLYIRKYPRSREVCSACISRYGVRNIQGDRVQFIVDMYFNEDIDIDTDINSDMVKDMQYININDSVNNECYVNNTHCYALDTELGITIVATLQVPSHRVGSVHRKIAMKVKSHKQ